MDVLLVMALGALLAYLAACAVWPFAACPRCGGTGKRRSPSGRAWRSCSRCTGSGRRVRVGRRVFEVFRGRDG